MECVSCGASGAGRYCPSCGAAQPEPEELAAIAELGAEAEVAQAHASETYAEAELERATHATEEDVELREAETEETEALAQADVAAVAIESMAEVAEAAIDAVTEVAEQPEPVID
jgi:hypothetical protein